MRFSGRGVLLDIEGTTSSIAFVYDEMFPFVRRELARYLTAFWDDAALREARDLMATDAGYVDFDDWHRQLGQPPPRELVMEEVRRLMDDDVKATGLKRLQGLIWQDGFESGQLRGHLYPDVVPAIRGWREQGLDIRIYSSGSVHAQRLFFGHTIEGDVRHLFSGHYDTTHGSKRDSASYQGIARDFALAPRTILFVSDVVAELDAARTAGLQTALCRRAGNAQVAPGHGHPAVDSLAEIEAVAG